MDGFSELRAVPPQIAELAAAIREACGEDDQAFADTLDGETDLVEAARKAVRFIDESEAMEAAVKSVADAYAKRAKAFAARRGRARAAITHFMMEIGQKTLALPEATLTLAVGAPSVVGEPDVAALPDHLVRTKREADRTAIKAALQAGECVPGCSLSNAAPVLHIRGR